MVKIELNIPELADKDDETEHIMIHIRIVMRKDFPKLGFSVGRS